jgi:hypothetical protein
METIVPTSVPEVLISEPKSHFPFKKVLLFLAIFVAAILPVFFFVSSLKDTDADISRIAHLSLAKEKIDDAIRRGVNIPLPTNALELIF